MTISSPTTSMIAKKDGAIGWMIFNNPTRLNAVSLEMWQAVPEILAAFEKDDEVRVIVLTGAGDRAFVAGADRDATTRSRVGPGVFAGRWGLSPQRGPLQWLLR